VQYERLLKAKRKYIGCDKGAGILVKKDNIITHLRCSNLIRSRVLLFDNPACLGKPYNPASACEIEMGIYITPQMSNEVPINKGQRWTRRKSVQAAE
jgi:hypothetical protein